MPNHYHFLIRAEEDGGIGPFLQRLFNSYTQAFNKQHKRSGTLFESRAKSILIEENGYLLHIARYIHLNPVRAGLTRLPEDWTYSDYPDFVGLRKAAFHEEAFVQDQFGTPGDYRKFVEDAIPGEIEWRIEKYKWD